MAEEKKEAAKTKRPTAAKRDMQSLKRRERNRQFTSQIKTAMRRFDDSLQGTDQELQRKELSRVFALMDKGHKKGIVPANAANRTKSRLATRMASKG